MRTIKEIDAEIDCLCHKGIELFGKLTAKNVNDVISIGIKALKRK